MLPSYFKAYNLQTNSFLKKTMVQCATNVRGVLEKGLVMERKHQIEKNACVSESQPTKNGPTSLQFVTFVAMCDFVNQL